MIAASTERPMLPSLDDDPDVATAAAQLAEASRRAGAATERLAQAQARLDTTRRSMPDYPATRQEVLEAAEAVSVSRAILEHAKVARDQAITAASIRLLRRDCATTDRTHLAQVATAAVALWAAVDTVKAYRAALERRGFQLAPALPDVPLPRELGDLRVRDAWLRELLAWYAEVGIATPDLDDVLAEAERYRQSLADA
jgi:hypothetical protein